MPSAHKIRADYAQLTPATVRLPSQSAAMTDKPRLLPIGPTARYLRVAAKGLREEAANGRVPHLRAGDRFLFDPEEVERALLERARRTRQGAGREGGAADA